MFLQLQELNWLNQTDWLSLDSMLIVLFLVSLAYCSWVQHCSKNLFLRIKNQFCNKWENIKNNTAFITFIHFMATIQGTLVDGFHESCQDIINNLRIILFDVQCTWLEDIRKFSSRWITIFSHCFRSTSTCSQWKSLVPIFRPELVPPPTRHLFPKIVKILVHFCIDFDYF